MGSTFYKKRYKWEDTTTRKKRPRTFKSEEAAKKYASDNDIKSYHLENLKSIASSSKKIRLVVS